MTSTATSPTTARVGVLCGGHSPERAGSLVSGEAAAKALAQAGIRSELIDVAETPVHDLAGRIDIALLGLHGLGGEDGKIQGALDTLNIPYTGSGVMASAIGMYKPMFKRILTAQRIDTPAWMIVDPVLPISQIVPIVTMALRQCPVFVKPCSGGGSLEAGLARDKDELSALLAATREHLYETYMVEEYVPGTPRRRHRRPAPPDPQPIRAPWAVTVVRPRPLARPRPLLHGPRNRPRPTLSDVPTVGYGVIDVLADPAITPPAAPASPRPRVRPPGRPRDSARSS